MKAKIRFIAACLLGLMHSTASPGVVVRPKEEIEFNATINQGMTEARELHNDILSKFDQGMDETYEESESRDSANSANMESRNEPSPSPEGKKADSDNLSEDPRLHGDPLTVQLIKVGGN